MLNGITCKRLEKSHGQIRYRPFDIAKFVRRNLRGCRLRNFSVRRRRHNVYDLPGHSSSELIDFGWKASEFSLDIDLFECHGHQPHTMTRALPLNRRTNCAVVDTLDTDSLVCTCCLHSRTNCCTGFSPSRARRHLILVDESLHRSTTFSSAHLSRKFDSWNVHSSRI